MLLIPIRFVSRVPCMKGSVSTKQQRKHESSPWLSFDLHPVRELFLFRTHLHNFTVLGLPKDWWPCSSPLLTVSNASIGDLCNFLIFPFRLPYFLVLLILLPQLLQQVLHLSHCFFVLGFRPSCLFWDTEHSLHVLGLPICPIGPSQILYRYKLTEDIWTVL
jgi:hypothetical protein